MTLFRKRLAASAALIGIIMTGISVSTNASAQSVQSVQSAEYIIFEVNGSAEGLSEIFELGAVLKDGDRIELPENSEIRLLDKAGEVVILTGPLVGTVLNEDGDSQKAKDGANALQVIAKLMFGKKGLVNNLGAARAVQAEPIVVGKDQAWVPVITKPGTYCLPMDVPVFSRVDSQKRVKVTVMAKGGVFVEKSWNKDENSISISDVVKKGTDSYTLFLSYQTTESSLHLLDRTDMNTTQQIAWMAERGCNSQALQLLNELSQEAE